CAESVGDGTAETWSPGPASRCSLDGCDFEHRSYGGLRQLHQRLQGGSVGVGTATIFWVEADKLLSVQSGGNIRSYNILRQLAAQHEITFFSYYDRERDVRYERALQVEFPNAVCLCIFSSAGVRRRLHHWYSDRPFDTESRCRYERAAAQPAPRL